MRKKAPESGARAARRPGQDGAYRSGRKSGFLAAFVRGGNDSGLETDPEKMLGAWPFLLPGRPALERKDGRIWALVGGSACGWHPEPGVPG